MCEKPTEIETEDISAFRAELGRLEAELRNDYEKHERELRRSIEISTSFFDKLSALDAGSIAVAASVIIAMSAQKVSISNSFPGIVHGLVAIVILLWSSLVCTVVHNFLAVHLAALDAKYSEIEFVRTMLRKTLATARQITPEISQSVVDELEKNVHKDPAEQQRKIVRRKQVLYPCVTILGYASIGTFLIAYTLVAFYVRRLW